MYPSGEEKVLIRGGVCVFDANRNTNALLISKLPKLPPLRGSFVFSTSQMSNVLNAFSANYE